MRRDGPSFRPALEDLEARTVPAAVGTPNQNFVDQLYRDVLGRAPDPASAGWVAALNRGTDRGDIVDGILDSPEGRRAQVSALYVRFLGRAADAGGLAFWSDFLRDNSNRELAAELMGSQEYFLRRGGGTNQGFLNAVYQDVLGRSISAREVSDRRDDFRDGARGRVDIAENILESDEAEDVRGIQSALSFLGVNLGAGQGRNLAGDDDDDTASAFARGLLSSAAYFNRAQTLTTSTFATIPSTGNLTALSFGGAGGTTTIGGGAVGTGTLGSGTFGGGTFGGGTVGAGTIGGTFGSGTVGGGTGGTFVGGSGGTFGGGTGGTGVTVGTGTTVGTGVTVGGSGGTFGGGTGGGFTAGGG